MSKKALITLPIPDANYNYVNEALTREQIQNSIQSIEDSLFLLKTMQESITSKSIKRHQFLLMGMKHV
jgi:hypothetical protein|tara:strand:- start:18495 stop:18698 length:204 start_codon:yes stop_codon:yes gene_type:complete